MNWAQGEVFAFSFQKSTTCYYLKHLLLNMSLLSLSVFLFEECARIDADLSLFSLALGWSNRLECVWWGGKPRRLTCLTPPPTLHMCLPGHKKTTWRAERSGKYSDEMHQGKRSDYFQSIKYQWKSTSYKSMTVFHGTLKTSVEELTRIAAGEREKEKQQKWQDKRNLDFVWESIDFFPLGCPWAPFLLLV